MNNKTTTRAFTTLAGATALALGLCAVGAQAATPRENTGVVGGAIAGAVAGGPVGLIAGAVIGGHYAGRSERIRSGERQADALNAQLDDLNARLAASTLALTQVEDTLRARNARVAEQEARISSLAEDQLLLSALELRVRFATGDSTVSEDDYETLAILDDEHDHDEEEHDAETHRDLLLAFTFECESPGDIAWIRVGLFDAFARIEELEVVYLDQTSQQSARLSPSNPQLDLTR